MDHFEHPFPLTDAADAHYQRLARQLYQQGRWASVSADLVAVYAQTLQTYAECVEAIAADGLLVAGRNNGAERVRHSLLTPLNQSRQALVYLAKVIPLANERETDRDHDFEKWMKEMEA